MATHLTDDSGAIAIAMGTSWPARLFGLPFLLVGLWLGHHLVEAVLDLANGRAAISEMFVGTLLLTIVTAAFLVPGWLLIASRASVEIDRMNGTVSSVRDLRVYRHVRSRPLSDFSHLEVDVLTVSSNSSRGSRSGYQVELAAPNRKNLLVGLFDAGEDAMVACAAPRPLIGLPVEDRRDIEAPAEER